VTTGGMSATDGVSLTTTSIGGWPTGVAFDFDVDFATAFGFGGAAGFGAAALRVVAVAFGAATFGAAGLVAGAFTALCSTAASFATTLGVARVDARPSFGAFRVFAGAAALASTSGSTGACGSSSGGAGTGTDAAGVDAGGDALAGFFPRNTGFAPGRAGTSPSIGVRSPEYFEPSSRVDCAGCFAPDARFDSSENCFTSSEARFSSSEKREGVDGGRSDGRWGGAFFAIEPLFFHEPAARRLERPRSIAK
jgi:hypothetical protein